MAHVLLFLLALASSWCLSSALDLHGKIQWNEQCSDLAALGPAKVLLDDGKFYGGVAKDGSFVIPEVPVGTFILSVLAHDHTFEQLRIDVVDTTAKPQVRPYIPGTPLNPPSTITVKYPITLPPRSKHVYFVPRESFNVLAMLQNPMIIMMVFAGGMMFAMPYLMKNLDPEMLEEFKQRQAKVAGIQSSLQNGDIKASIAAMLPSDEPPRNTAPSSKSEEAGNAKAQQATAHNRKKGKKR